MNKMEYAMEITGFIKYFNMLESQLGIAHDSVMPDTANISQYIRFPDMRLDTLVHFGKVDIAKVVDSNLFGGLAESLRDAFYSFYCFFSNPVEDFIDLSVSEKDGGYNISIGSEAMARVGGQDYAHNLTKMIQIAQSAVYPHTPLFLVGSRFIPCMGQDEVPLGDAHFAETSLDSQYKITQGRDSLYMTSNGSGILTQEEVQDCLILATQLFSRVKMCMNFTYDGSSAEVREMVGSSRRSNANFTHPHY